MKKTNKTKQTNKQKKKRGMVDIFNVSNLNDKGINFNWVWPITRTSEQA